MATRSSHSANWAKAAIVIAPIATALIHAVLAATASPEKPSA
jgi:hypothetical protein